MNKFQCIFFVVFYFSIKDEFFCHPAGCLNNSHKCDGIVDCSELTDEKDCGNTTIKSDNTKEMPFVGCSQYEFTCDNLECISRYFRCDGMHYINFFIKNFYNKRGTLLCF